MGCYGCGSHQGDESRLCPDCTQKKLSHRAANPFEPGDPPITRPRRTLKEILSIAVVLASLGGSGYFLAYHPAGPGYMLPAGERLYYQCQRKFASQFKTKRSANTENNEMAEAFAGAFDQMFQGLAVGLCDELRQECQRDPNGRNCQALIRAMK